VYIYDGALSPSVVDSIRDMMKRYPHPLEMKSVPGLEFLPEVQGIGEGCMGEPYVKTYRAYGITWKTFPDPSGGAFLFLATAAERQMVLDRHRDLVVNEQPFKTRI
jgi:hypothetical protein